MPFDLFISYSRRDNERGQVTVLKAQIESSFRAFAGRELRVFFDHHEINCMEDWRQRILQGLRESRLLPACLAWAMGAQVAVVRDSGREADVLEQEIKENESHGMLVVPPDAMTLRAFIHMSVKGCSAFTETQVERLARFMHARYLEEGRHKLGDRTMREWENLDGDIKNSNREQVTYMPQILNSVGFTVEPLAAGDGLVEFSDEDMEIMGEMEHGRWNVERLRQGWHYGKEANLKGASVPISSLGMISKRRPRAGTDRPCKNSPSCCPRSTCESFP